MIRPSSIKRACEARAVLSWPFVCFVLSALLFAGAMLLDRALVGAFFVEPDKMDIARQFGISDDPAVLQTVAPKQGEALNYVLALVWGIVFLALGVMASFRGRDLRLPNMPRPVLWGLCGGALAVFVAQREWRTFWPDRDSLLWMTAFESNDLFVMIIWGVILALVYRAVMSDADRRWRWAVIGIGFLSELWLGSRIITTMFDPILVSTHFEVMTFPIIQDYLGKALLIDQNSQYGLYPFFLRPLWQFAPPEPFYVTCVMGTLIAAGLLFQTAHLVRHAHNRSLAMITALGAFLFSLFWYAMWPNDMYMQYFPLRTFFVGMAFFWASFDAPKSVWGRHLFHGAAYMVFAGSIFWNIESGVVSLAVYFISALLWEATKRRGAFAIMRLFLYHSVCAGAAVLLSFGLLNLYYQMRFGALPPWGEVLYFIRLFAAGFCSITPMEQNGVWQIAVLIYFGSLFYGARGLFLPLSPRDKRARIALIALAVFGALFLKYFQARSHTVFLAWVLYPALLCVGLLLDQALAAAGKGSGTPYLRGAVAAWLVFCAIFLTGFLSYVGEVWPEVRRPAILSEYLKKPAPLDQKIDSLIAFTRAHQAGPDRVPLIVAGFGNLMHLRMGQASPLGAVGLCQLMLKKDLDQIEAVARDPKTDVLIYENNTTLTGCYIPPLQPEKWGYVRVKPEGFDAYPKLELYLRRQK